MIFSAFQLFSDNQAITGDAVSTNVLDTLPTGIPAHAFSALEKDLGKGNPVPISIQVTEVFNTLTSLTIELQVSVDEAFSSPIVVATETILLADLVVGKRTGFQYLPKGTDERFMRLNYDVNGTDPTTGEIHAGIVSSLDQTWGT